MDKDDQSEKRMKIFGSTIRACDLTKKWTLILLLRSIASVVTVPAGKVNSEDVSIRLGSSYSSHYHLFFRRSSNSF